MIDEHEAPTLTNQRIASIGLSTPPPQRRRVPVLFLVFWVAFGLLVWGGLEIGNYIAHHTSITAPVCTQDPASTKLTICDNNGK
jgi:hypothetical protein